MLCFQVMEQKEAKQYTKDSHPFDNDMQKHENENALDVKVLRFNVALNMALTKYIFKYFIICPVIEQS